MRKRIRVISLFATLVITTVLTGCGAVTESVARKEVEEYVAGQIAEPVMVGVTETLSSNGVDEPTFRYTLISEERPMSFQAWYEPDMNFPGQYNLGMAYAKGVKDYYTEDLQEVIKEYPKNALEDDSWDLVTKVYMDNEEDARALSEMLAACNEIVSDQFNYTPGADLTDYRILNLNFVIVSSEGENIGNYVLDGIAEADDIYAILLDMLSE